MSVGKLRATDRMSIVRVMQLYDGHLVRRKVARDGQDVRRTGDAMYDGDRFSPVQLAAYPTFSNQCDSQAVESGLHARGQLLDCGGIVDFMRHVSEVGLPRF